MRNLKLFLIIIFQSIIFIRAGYIRDKLINEKVIKVVRMGPCLRTNLPYKHFFQIGKTNLRSVFVTNATAIAKEDLEDNLRVTISINRCGSRENLDSCEDYHKFRNLDYCKCISAEDMFPGAINPIIFPFEPKLRCPIKKGAYKAFNFTFNFTPFLMFNLDGWYWRTKVEVISPKENNRAIECLDAEGYTKL